MCKRSNPNNIKARQETKEVSRINSAQTAKRCLLQIYSAYAFCEKGVSLIILIIKTNNKRCKQNKFGANSKRLFDPNLFCLRLLLLETAPAKGASITAKVVSLINWRKLWRTTYPSRENVRFFELNV